MQAHVWLLILLVCSHGTSRRGPLCIFLGWLQTKESKKIIRTYNKVARALIEYETLWHHAWCKSIEAAKSGLQATLIIRHPRSGMLFVNFDREILQLIREAKFLQRMGAAHRSSLVAKSIPRLQLRFSCEDHDRQ
jgi:hypothetical protein